MERHCQRIRSQPELDVKLAETESATQGKLAVAKRQEQASLETHLKAVIKRTGLCFRGESMWLALLLQWHEDRSQEG